MCFCQKVSGLISSAVWMLEENDSCSVRSTGFTLSHLLPRMSTTTVKPRARTSSLPDRQASNVSSFQLSHYYLVMVTVLPGYGRQVGDQSAEIFLFYSIMIGPGREGQDWSTALVSSTC